MDLSVQSVRPGVVKRGGQTKNCDNFPVQQNLQTVHHRGRGTIGLLHRRGTLEFDSVAAVFAFVPEAREQESRDSGVQFGSVEDRLRQGNARDSVSVRFVF